jgi:SnoaL-like domain
MQAAVTQTAPEDVCAFVQEYFDAWKGTDVDKILAYYSDDVIIHLPSGTLAGKGPVRDNFVRPFLVGFPGNIHAIRSLAVPGCSFYEYDLGTRTIPAGRIYFDLGTLLRQIDAGA